MDYSPPSGIKPGASSSAAFRADLQVSGPSALRGTLSGRKQVCGELRGRLLSCLRRLRLCFRAPLSLRDDTAVLKAPLEPNQQPNYTPSGTPNETGPEAARKQAEAARGSGRNPQAEAARKPLANPLHACFRPACMRQSLLPSSSYEASGRADQVHRCHRLGSVFSCSSTRQACMRNITIASVDASHDGDFCLRLSPSASA